MAEIIQKAKCELCAAFLAILKFIVTRLAQPSTWASIASLFTLLHVSIPDGLWQHIVDAGIAVSGLVGVILNERGVKVLSGQQDIDGTKNGPNSTQG